MLINADFSARAAVATNLQPWVPSPQPGVDRRMLDRVGLEKARATSLVRYAPAASYPAHEHPAAKKSWCCQACLLKTDAITRPAPTCATRPGRPISPPAPRAR